MMHSETMPEPLLPPRSAAPLSRDERAELEVYREWSAKVAAVCDLAARGNLEARLLGCDAGGDVAIMVRGINHLLDVTDAFVRESKPALDCASRGEFFRRVILRGLPGTFRHAATLINDATDRMKEQAHQLKTAAQRRVELAAEFEATIQDVVTAVASSATEMQATAQSLARMATDNTAQASAVADAASETSLGVEAVASATEELSSSAREIGRRTDESARLARGAVTQSEHTNVVMADLSKASSKIGKVVKLISEIAKQTNLLALNATIEAARAGTVGKGFAVVASEVKDLARQTHGATDEIEVLISDIQRTTEQGVDANCVVTTTVRELCAIATTIAESVHQQQLATGEIGGNVTRAASGTRDVSESAGIVSRIAGDASDAAAALLGAASDLSTRAEDLLVSTSRFVAVVRG